MILEAKNIWKRFHGPEKIDVLKGVSLSVARGESVAICGRSGEGKTTLLHILGTLEEPDEGQVKIAGKEWSASTAHKIRNQHIGFIFQSYNLLDDFTVLENVLMPARIGRRPVDAAQGLKWLKRLNLEARAYFPAKLLSGGERQRVAIARALASNPDIILADEPSGNLDRAHAEQVGQLLLSLVREEKKGLILVTHDPALAALSDRRYTLSGGLLLEGL